MYSVLCILYDMNCVVIVLVDQGVCCDKSKLICGTLYSYFKEFMWARYFNLIVTKSYFDI